MVWQICSPFQLIGGMTCCHRDGWYYTGSKGVPIRSGKEISSSELCLVGVAYLGEVLEGLYGVTGVPPYVGIEKIDSYLDKGEDKDEEAKYGTRT